MAPEQLISLIIGMAGCFVGLAGWLAGRDKKLAGDARWRGSVDAKLDIVVRQGKTLDDIDRKVDAITERLVAVEASARQAHKRIDSMEKKGENQ